MSDELFNNYLDSVVRDTAGHPLRESLVMEDNDWEETEKMLATPDPRPCDFDRTFEAWLHRLSLWGKVTIIHVDPEMRSKREVTQQVFLKKLTSQEPLKAFGKWDIQMLNIDKVRLARSYTGLDGKTVTEEFFVNIKLDPKMQQAVNKRKKIFGIF